MSVGAQISVFLIHTVFTLYILALMLRVLLGAMRADFYNPLSQTIVTVTDPAVVPARRLIPSTSGVEVAAIVLIVGLKLVELILLALIAGAGVNPLALLGLALVQLAELLIWIFIFAILAQVVLSWVAPQGGGYRNPATPILHALTQPLLRPVRRVVPPVGMVDLSPLVVIMGLYVVLIVLRSFH